DRLCKEIDYSNIFLIKNHHKLSCNLIPQDQIYEIMTNIKRFNNLSMTSENILDECINTINKIKSENDQPIDVHVMTQNRIVNDKWINLLDKIKTLAHVLHTFCNINYP